MNLCKPGTREHEARAIALMQQNCAYHGRVAMNGYDPLLMTASKVELQDEARQRHGRMLARLVKLVSGV
ncbi:MAG: hypothetical protein ABFE07_24140 [Armatimonadia bacterium]